MNPPDFRPHRPASSSPIRTREARPTARRIARLILLCATAFMHADIGLAASGPFDGTYKGTFALSSRSSSMGTTEVQCENINTLEQVMSISGGQVYLDRKSPYPNPLLLSGIVSPDGSVSATGVALSEGGNRNSVYFTLVGRIENGAFEGNLGNRYCNWNVTMKK